MASAPIFLSLTNLSIHLLNYKNKLLESQEKVEKFIHLIFEQYKEREELHTANYEAVSMNKWKIREHNGFHAQLYYCRRTIRTKFSMWVSSMSDSSPQFEKVDFDFIFFLYRKISKTINEKVETQWELFALTTNQGWQVVKNYANLQFPHKIALRIIDPHFSSADKKPLTGYTDASSEIYRTEYPLTQNEMETVWKWFKGFDSHFKVNSSLYNPDYKLTDLTTPVKKRRAKISVHVGLGRIRIPASLTIEQCEKFLVHFSRIFQGQPTYIVNQFGKKEQETEDSSIRYLENIQKVDSQIIPKLTNGILAKVWHCFHQKTPAGGLWFAHRFYKDFYLSGTFCLKYKQQEIEWFYRPSVSQIMHTLRALYGPLSAEKEFYQALSKTTFKFDSRKKFFPIGEFFHGELQYQEERYFRIDSIWLKVHADQLIILQRDFSAFLRKSLDLSKPSLLSKPWIANIAWTAFDMDWLRKATHLNSKEAELLLTQLQDTTFSFLDSNGRVSCNYPTYCLLDEGAPYTPTLKKRWDKLTQLLLNQSKKKQSVTQQDLEKLLKTKSNKQEEWGKSLLDALKEPRKVMVSLPCKIKTISLLDPAGVPRFPNVSNFSFRSAALKTHKVAINRLLKKKYAKKEPLTEKDLKAIKIVKKRKSKPIPARSAHAIFQEFSQNKRLKTGGDLSQGQFVMQGPPPATGNPSADLFFQARHADYRLIAEEEGYNRSYLAEEGFLVGDQSYAGKREKVELFDLLHFEKNRKEDARSPLSLIHVKEGFGQKTREACAQIRVAAINIDNALKQNAQILRGFYQGLNGIDVATASPFRAQLKNKLIKDFPDEDSFIRLFQNKATQKQICFVYAFVDDSEGEERFLDEERNPNYTFKKDDFLPFNQDDQDAEKLVNQLKKENILDSHNHLTEKFLRMTQPEFLAKLSDRKRGLDIYKFLSKQVSQFDSLTAKIELLELQKFLDHLGFQFKICQILRSNRERAKSSHPLQYGEDPLPQDWESFAISSVAFEYDKKKFKLKKQPIQDNAILAILLRTKNLEHPLLEFYTLVSKHIAEPAVIDYLAGQKMDTISQIKKFTRAEWELAAKLLNYKMVLFSRNPSDRSEIVTQNPEEVNPAGAKIVYLVKDENAYQEGVFLTEDELESEAVVEPPSQPATWAVISEEARKLLLSQEVNIGLHNACNDCFFNSMFQLIIHSKLLLNYFSDNSNISRDRAIADTSMIFFKFFEDLIFTYLTSPSRIRYKRDVMRAHLKFSPNGQEDASEVLNRIFSYYNTLPLIRAEATKQADLKSLNDRNKLSSNAPFQSYTSVDDNGSFTIQHEYPCLPIDLPVSSGNDFVEILSNNLNQKTEEDAKLKFLYKGVGYIVDRYTQLTNYSVIADEFFLHVKRFIGSNKNNSPLGIQRHIYTIDGKQFSLQGFIVHIGARPHGGHYVAYCKREAGWRKFNDDHPIQSIKDEAILQEADKAYILHFKKCKEEDQKQRVDQNK